MNKFVFSKNGDDKEIIIEKILDFIKTHWNSLRPANIVIPGSFPIYPCKKMASIKEELSYIIVDVYDRHSSHKNHILQFSTGEGLSLLSQKAIWLDEGTEIEFDENKREISIKRSLNTITLIVC